MKRINLVIQTAFIGDTILSISMLKYLKKMYPQDHNVLFCRKGLKEIFLSYQLVDEVIEVDKKSKQDLKNKIQQLKQKKYHIIVSPHESIRTHIMVNQLQAKTKIGFKKFWNGWVFDKTITRDWSLPEALRQLSLLSLIDRPLSQEMNHPDFLLKYKNLSRQETLKEEFLNLKLPKNGDISVDKDLVDDSLYNDFLKKHQLEFVDFENVVFMAPGSVWKTKKWTDEGFQKLAQLLLNKNYKIILVGSPQESELCESIKSQFSDTINMAGKTSLFEMTLLFRKGVALIANDSSLLHFGAMMKMPAVGIFGPTTLNLGFRPWDQKSIVVQKKLKCRPCGKHGHDQCPIKTHECMTSIQAEDVFESLEYLLNYR